MLKYSRKSKISRCKEKAFVLYYPPAGQRWSLNLKNWGCGDVLLGQDHHTVTLEYGAVLMSPLTGTVFKSSLLCNECLLSYW